MTRMTPQSGAPPGKERTGPTAKDRLSTKTTGCGSAVETVTPTSDIPVHRPWSGRADAHAVELRFRRDRAGWRRRVDAARRLAYDGRDVVAPGGRWNSIEAIGVER
jgi:hypothetical protein